MNRLARDFSQLAGRSPAFSILRSQAYHKHQISNFHLQNSFQGFELQAPQFDISGKKFKTLFVIKSWKMKEKLMKTTEKKLNSGQFHSFVMKYCSNII
jgi:hypothetical protein